ncbi:MAG: GNAT family N-acetyltransferase [Planctomycetes bacterium]|nr:GNAT family N-acetyltransferase [Planctomycetota bacterium]
MTANTTQYNRAGQRSLEKVGFTHEGTQRECVVLGGKRWDKLMYGMLRQEFFYTYGHPDITMETSQE